MPTEYPHREFPTAPPVPRALVDDLVSHGVPVVTETRERAEHARDWWPRSIPVVARGDVENWPSVVARPRTTTEVSAVLRVATEHRVPVTAQGGRSSVVGGAVPTPGAIALDLTGLDRIIDVDSESQTVRVEAGVVGPNLEAYLGHRGFTVGHFPQSFDLATVGGWIACRGAGQYSNLYGPVASMVRALTVVLANGNVVHLGRRGPHEALGPDLLQLFVGSEGTLGIITEATLVVRPRAPHEEHGAFLFSHFDEGMNACRRSVQRGARPAVLRLYDEIESRRHFDVDGCALIVLVEGDSHLVSATVSIVDDECAGARRLPPTLVDHWLATRNDVTALAPMWERGFVVDTIEVAGPWTVLGGLHQRVTEALLTIDGMLSVSVHQSHAYLDGACLYFTFVARPTGDADDLYRRAWDDAMCVVMALGAAISHHHGVGRARARFAAATLGSAFAVLESLKRELDPLNILNPGVLGLGGEPW